MNHDAIAHYLTTHADAVYNAFNARIVATTLPTIGVRIPDLRALAKEIERSGWATDFLTTQKAETLDEMLLRGFVIAGRKIPLMELMPIVETFVPGIESWAACDTFCGSLKRVIKEREAWWGVIERYAKSDREFEVRFAVVLSMSHYLAPEWIDLVLELWARVDATKGYYVEMALGWGLATGVAKEREKTLEALASGRYSPAVLRRAVRKSCESLRVSAEDKNYLKSLLK